MKCYNLHGSATRRVIVLSLEANDQFVSPASVERAVTYSGKLFSHRIVFELFIVV